MVSTDLLLAIVFYGILIILFLRYRNRFTVQGVIVMLRTKLGLKSMDKLGKKHPKTFNFFGILGVIIGFVGMAIIFWVLIEGSYKLLFVPESQPVIAPVLPGITIPGLPTLLLVRLGISNLSTTAHAKLIPLRPSVPAPGIGF